MARDPRQPLISTSVLLRVDQADRLHDLAQQEGLSASCFLRRLLDKTRAFQPKEVK